nr:MBL fold metallo-hydrolase [Chloroflexota bacterium]
MAGWLELGDRVFVRRYAFFDQNIGLVLGDGEALVIDTRTTPAHARELQRHIRELTRLPVRFVVDTHGHSDHAFGNATFRPATIWGHDRCRTMLEKTGERQRDGLIARLPDLADDLAELVVDPPDRTFAERATILVGGRPVELRYLGRGHTDNDIAVLVPDDGIVFAGDLLENGAVPWFGDAYPIDWPATVEGLLGLIGVGVVPGHGDHAGRRFAADQLELFRAIASLGPRVHAGELSLAAAARLAPIPDEDAVEP